MLKNIIFSTLEFKGGEDVIIVPITKETTELKGPARKLDKACGLIIEEYLRRGSFKPNTGETMLLPTRMNGAPRHLLLLGFGERSQLTPEQVMTASGNAAHFLRKRRFKRCHLLLGSPVGGISPNDFSSAFIKGFSLAQYRYSLREHKEDEHPVEELTILTSYDRRKLKRRIDRTKIIIEHTAITRDMVNEPANEFTPSKMAERARSLAKEHDIYCRILGPKDITKLGMGAIMGVCKGSAEEPRLIFMHYNRKKPHLPMVCLVGKGVTFDSGGISIKSWEHMDEMKGDMAGGAVVINAITAASRLNVPLQIVGIVPCVENMPSQKALKPGDVIKTHSGKTIEIVSTDAEGRLILSDAISYARTFKPKVIIDFATLTGACIIALGKEMAGVIGNNQKLIDLITKTGRKVGERVWQLPLDESFKTKIKGDVADYKNYSGKDASSITAAALIGEFACDIPWVHVDIAGPYWSNGGKPSWRPKGGTGFGVEIAVSTLEALASRRNLRQI